MDNFLSTKKEIFEWNSYQFFESHIQNPQDLLELDLFPQVYFEDRNQNIYCGLGSIPVEKDLLEIFEKLPSDYSFFIQRDFTGSNTQVWLPQVQIGKNNKLLIVEKRESPLTLKKRPKATAPFKLGNRKNIPNKDDWNSLFNTISAKFNENAFKKIVPARKVSFELTESINTFVIFQKIIKQGSYNYFLSSNETECFFGSSPERLLSFQNNTLFTEAIAGTRTKERAQELLTSEKDLYEHRLVVEDILQKLKPFAMEVRVPNAPVLTEAKNLSHLKTPIEAKLATGDLFSILDSLHPTSAVCGMPKASSMNFLLENESFDRKKYAGFLGVVNKSYAEVCVCLRCCEITNTQLNLYSGVGVVPQSNCDHEWQELEDKIQPYLELFNELQKTHSIN